MSWESGVGGQGQGGAEVVAQELESEISIPVGYLSPLDYTLQKACEGKMYRIIFAFFSLGHCGSEGSRVCLKSHSLEVEDLKGSLNLLALNFFPLHQFMDGDTHNLSRSHVPYFLSPPCLVQLVIISLQSHFGNTCGAPVFPLRPYRTSHHLSLLQPLDWSSHTQSSIVPATKSTSACRPLL